MASQTSIDPQEIAQFQKDSMKWWDPKGPFRALHHINPVRSAYILDHIGTKPKEILDIGCGGGLLSEALADKGHKVLGIDADEQAVQVAQNHAADQFKNLSYKNTTAEDLIKQGKTYDTVCALEILEHVAAPKAFLENCCKLVKPHGYLFLSTLNKTPQAALLSVGVAEYMLGIVPRGTHDPRKFIKPSQIRQWLEPYNFHITDIKGIAYNPFTFSAKLTDDLSINYILVAKRSAA